MNETLLSKIESEVIRNVINASGLTTEYVVKKYCINQLNF